MVPINVTSAYSLLESTIQPAELVKVAQQQGYSAVALTDRNVMYGAIEFYHAAKAAGVTPLLGVQFQLAGLELTAYARGNQGYQQLIKLSTRLATNQALTVTEFLTEVDQLAVVIAPATILQALQQPELAAALEQLIEQPAQMRFAGITLTLDQVQRTALVNWATKHQVALIAFDPVEYLAPTDYFATQVLRAIKSGHRIKEPLRLVNQTGEHFLKPAQAWARAYQTVGLAQAAANTEQLAAACQVEITFQSPVLPTFKVPAGQSQADYLRQLCEAGLQARGLTAATYQARLDHELTQIHNLGFDDYFLIVWDVMHFAHEHQITTGPGRGSAAGSLVAYALAITDVDPLRYHLLFERFLNPERAQMPDIDLDLPDNRRQEVLDYLHQRYGHQRIAQIITFGTLAAKQAIKDVARVFMLPAYLVSELNTILANIQVRTKLTIDEALRKSQALVNLMNDQPQIALLIKVAKQLEGLPRHDSIHAAGVVLSQAPLAELVPLQGGQDGELLVTQYAKETVEAVGLLKMDFLGLRNLSIMDKALRLIHHHQPQFNLKKVDLNDPATLHLFAAGDTDGIFQFESRGIRQVLTKLAPDQFEELVAVNALYRPGPLDNITHFIARKQGHENYQLPDASLAAILGPTYGILVYQEQVMQVAAVMAGFSLGQADLLRRAMSKKKQATMDAMRSRFLTGAKEKGYAPQLAQQVFDYIDQFANYGFNRSHAVAYSKMAFEMAYLKVHFPNEFFVALLSIEPNIAKQRQHFANAQQHGVRIVGPRINVSQADFSLARGEIIVGFNAVKGLRADFIQAILAARQTGPFQDIYDFLARLAPRWHKAALLEPLFAVGAFDGLGYNRAELLVGLPGLLAGSEFTFQDPSLQPLIERRPELPLGERLAKESEYLGVYLSGHPASQYQALRQRLGGELVADLGPNQKVTLVVLLTRIRVVNTKKTHQQMAFVTASDESGSINLTVFARQFAQYEKLLSRPNQVVVVAGQVELRNDELEVIVNQLQPANQLQTGTAPQLADRRWVLRLLPEVAERGRQQIKAILRAHPGNCPVVIYEEQTNQARQLTVGAAADEATRAAFNAALGSANVVLQLVPPLKK